MSNILSIEERLQIKRFKDIDKKAQEHMAYLSQKSQELAIQYIDKGVDEQFKKIYGHGAGSDDDFFGKCFAYKLISHSVKRLKESRDDYGAQLKVMQNFGLSVKGLCDHVMKPVVDTFKAQISDSVTGLDNYQDLAYAFNNDVQVSTNYYECKKVIIDNCFKRPVKIALRRIK